MTDSLVGFVVVLLFYILESLEAQRRKPGSKLNALREGTRPD